MIGSGRRERLGRFSGLASGIVGDLTCMTMEREMGGTGKEVGWDFMMKWLMVQFWGGLVVDHFLEFTSYHLEKGCSHYFPILHPWLSRVCLFCVILS